MLITTKNTNKRLKTGKNFIFTALATGIMIPGNDLDTWLEKLKNSAKLIIVEGIKDKKALERIGIDSERIITLSRKPLFGVAEDAANASKDCIILTDLDKEGKKLYGTLSSNLQRLGIRIDNYFRQWLFRNTKLRQIEGLLKYINTHRKNTGVTNTSRNAASTRRRKAIISRLEESRSMRLNL